MYQGTGNEGNHLADRSDPPPTKLSLCYCLQRPISEPLFIRIIIVPQRTNQTSMRQFLGKKYAELHLALHPL